MASFVAYWKRWLVEVEKESTHPFGGDGMGEVVEVAVGERQVVSSGIAGG